MAAFLKSEGPPMILTYYYFGGKRNLKNFSLSILPLSAEVVILILTLPYPCDWNYSNSFCNTINSLVCVVYSKATSFLLSGTESMDWIILYMETTEVPPEIILI